MYEPQDRRLLAASIGESGRQHLCGPDSRYCGHTQRESSSSINDRINDK